MLRDLFVFGGIPTLLLYYGDESLSRKNSHLWGGCRAFSDFSAVRFTMLNGDDFF